MEPQIITYIVLLNGNANISSQKELAKMEILFGIVCHFLIDKIVQQMAFKDLQKILWND